MSAWGKKVERFFNLHHLPLAERNKQRLAVELALFILIAGSLYNLLYISLGFSKVAIGSILSLVHTSTNLLVFRKTGNFKFFITSQLLNIFVFGLITHALIGGFVDSSGLGLCTILPAIGALLFSSQKVARLMFVFYCIGLVLIGSYEFIHIAEPYRLPRWLSLVFFVANFIFISGIIYFVVESFHTKVLAFQSSLEQEKEKSEALLLNILPATVIDELKEKGKSSAKLFSHVSVLFTDFVNFTSISEHLSPEDLVAEIDYCFKAFDSIVEKNGLEKIKTIGDAYLAVCGMPEEDEMHAYKVAKAGLEIVDFVETRKQTGGRFEIRVGINSGPLVAGIVGIKKYAYDIWGDTVNTASRMESSGEKGKVNISEVTYELIKDKFNCVHRGKIEVKNKGMMDMYFIETNN